MHPVLCTCDRCNHFGNHNKGESMTDKELLELAAKAAGYQIHVWGAKGSESFARMDQSHAPRWNPLKDDGDALRLAVKLKIHPRPYDSAVFADHESCLAVYNILEDYSDHRGDMDAATRRAIVRAAAEIGKATS